MNATPNEFGPVQMLVIGFATDSLSGKVLEELKRLREADIVRLVDLLVVAKDDEGDLAVVQATDLTQDEAMEFGALVGALIGFGTGDDETMEAAAVAGATAGADSHLIDDAEAWYVADAIPNGTTAAVALLEHRWAIPFRDAIVDQGGIVLADEALLEQRHREPAPDRYRQHLVHVHPEGLYSIVALVWKPGQATPIHDHRCWCVVGVWRGLERETTYNLHSDNGTPYLLQRHVVETRPGDVSVLVPPDEDIHRVENGGKELAISVHVYGDDISVLGSSINEQFSEDLIRTRSWSQGTVPVSWRATTK
jgi:predicted metal-dependent enzyme (double-stranded beta helix superfamily)/uncharacterized membrane protein